MTPVKFQAKSVDCFFDFFVSFFVAIFFVFIVVVLFSLFTTTSLQSLWYQLRSPVVFSAIKISLETSLVVVMLTFFLGLPVAYFLALKDFNGKSLLDTLLDIPIVLPPLVSGLALLILFGGTSYLGKLLNEIGFKIIFTKKGIIIAQFFVASPFFIKTAKESIQSIPKNLIAASATLGASSFYTFRKIILPLSKSGILAGLVMTWARAMGEFGATAMVAGCIPGKTETMTIAIYMQSMSGDLSSSTAIAFILTIFAFISLLTFKIRFRSKWI
ncbi:ABC transporter permease [Thermodesulfatator indicus]